MAESLMSQNWDPFIQAMVQKTHTPQLEIQSAKIKAVQTQTNELRTLETHLSDLQKLVRQLKDGVGLNVRTVEISEKNVATVSVADGTLAGHYRINISRLATATECTGDTSICGPLIADGNLRVPLSDLSLNAPLREGFFTINGQQIEVSASDSFESVFNKLTEKGVNPIYDASTDKITLSSNQPLYLGAPNDTSNLLDLLRLYTSETSTTTSITRLNTLKLDQSLENLHFKVPVTSDGKISINGVEIEYSKTDSLGSILSKINQANAGVFIHYLPSSQSFSVTNKVPGSLGLSLRDVSGNLIQSMGLNVASAQITPGQNAAFSINNGPEMISTTNTFSQAQHGIAGLSIQASKLGTTEFSIKVDEKTALETLQKFVTKYNAIQDYLLKETKADPKTKQFGAFHSNTAIKQLMSGLRNTLFGFSGEGISNYEKLSAVGLSFDKDHHLQLNANTFTQQIREAPEHIARAFSTAGSPMDATVSFLTNCINSTIKSVRTSFSAQKASLEQKLQRMERLFAAQEESWRKTFEKVKELNARMYAQVQAVNSLTKQQQS